MAKNDNEYQRLAYWADELPTNQDEEEIQCIINYLKSHVTWKQLLPFIKVGPDTVAAIGRLWRGKRNSTKYYSIQIRSRKLPDQLFRYTPFHPARLKELFCDNVLYLPSPSHFNDPFDCSLDEESRLTFIDAGIGCFSSKDDNILMFSHYADRHRGICFGVDSIKLVQSMSEMNNGIEAQIRPVWYFSVLPTLDFRTQPALSATCKDDLWSYEDEHRLFMVHRANLKPFGRYPFNSDAFTSVIFGCKASDECVSYIKSITGDLSHLEYFKAHQDPNRFGVKLLRIRRLGSALTSRST